MKFTEYKNAFAGIEMNDEHKQIMLDKVLQSVAAPEVKTVNASSFKRQRTFGWKKSFVAGALASILVFLAIFIPLSLIDRGGKGGNNVDKEAILSIVRKAQFTPDLKKLLPESFIGNSDAQAKTESLSNPKNQAAPGVFASSVDQTDILGLLKIDVEELENNQATPGYMLDEEGHFDFLIETSKRDKELAISSIENCGSMGEWYVLRNNNSSVKFSEYTVDKKDFLEEGYLTGARLSRSSGLVLAKYTVIEVEESGSDVSDEEIIEDDIIKDEKNEGAVNDNEESEDEVNEVDIIKDDVIIEVLLHYIGIDPDISLKKRYVIYPDDVVEIFSDHDHNPKWFLENSNHINIGYDNIPYLINKKDSEFFSIEHKVELYGDFSLFERKRVTVASYKKTGDDFEGLRMYNEYRTRFDWNADTNQYVANGDISTGQRAEVSLLSGNKEEYFRLSTQRFIPGDLFDKDVEVPQAYEYSLYKDKKWFNASTGVIFDKHDTVWVDGIPQNIYRDVQALSLWFTHNNFKGIKSYYGDLNFSSYDTKFIELRNGEFLDSATAPLFCGNNIHVYDDYGNYYQSGIRIPVGDWVDNGFGVGPYTAETHIGAYRPLNSTQSLEEFALSLIRLPDGITMDFAADLGIMDKLPGIVEELSLLDVNDIINNPYEILDKLNQGFILDKFTSFDLDEIIIRDSVKRL